MLLDYNYMLVFVKSLTTNLDEDTVAGNTGAVLTMFQLLEHYFLIKTIQLNLMTVYQVQCTLMILVTTIQWNQ